MKALTTAALAACAAGAMASCNNQRKQECERFLAAMPTFDAAPASLETVRHARDAIEAIAFEDEPLREYAKTTKATLAVLSNTLSVSNSPSPPEGTDDVIKQQLKEARTNRDDVVRYCSQ
jgi:hypothetical protein